MGAATDKAKNASGQARGDAEIQAGVRGDANRNVKRN